MMLAVMKYDSAMCRSHSWLPQQCGCVICKHSVALLIINVQRVLTNTCTDKHTPISMYLESTGVPRSLHRSKENWLSSDRDTIRL